MKLRTVSFSLVQILWVVIYFSLIWYGGRASIIIGLLQCSNYYGNWYCIRMYQWCVRLLLDSVMMRITEVAGSIPSILLILLITGFLAAITF